MRTLLTNATLIDCVQLEAVEGAAVLIENGRIREIRTDGSAPAADGAPSIDLRGAYLMPGLWDVHIHPDYYLPTEMPLADQVTLFGHRMMAALTESGITGLRCAGAHHYMDVAWKRPREQSWPIPHFWVRLRRRLPAQATIASMSATLDCITRAASATARAAIKLAVRRVIVIDWLTVRGDG